MEPLSVVAMRGYTPPARVFVQALGNFTVVVDGNVAVIEGGGVGREHLRRMLAYALYKVGRPILFSDLRCVASKYPLGGDPPVLERPNYPINGLCSMLRSWGLEEAFQRSETTFTLQRHPAWISDVDAIDAAYNQAVHCERAGDLSHGIALLNAIAPLCNGDYLHEFHFFGENRLDEQTTYWNSVQRQALLTLARLCLSHTPPQYMDLAYAAARRAIDLGGCGSDAYDIAAHAAERCGHRELARHYRYVAQQQPTKP